MRNGYDICARIYAYSVCSCGENAQSEFVTIVIEKNIAYQRGSILDKYLRVCTPFILYNLIRLIALPFKLIYPL